MRSWSLSSLATKLAFAIVLVLVPAVALLLQYAKLPHASPVVAAGIVTALLAAAVIGGFAVRRVLVGLGRASDALDHLRNGRLDAELGTTGNDDAGRVLRGIEALRTTMKAARDEDHARAGEQERALAELRARGERDRASATENGRARLALDTVSAAVLLADASGRVTYANAAVAELLRTRAAALRAKIAGFDPEQLLGVTLDVLCPGADFERIAKTDTKELAYADATFRVVASPVLDANGVRAGVVLQWFDRTQDVASEDEINFVVQAAVEGDLTQRIRADDKAGYFRVLVDGVNRLLASMAETVRTMQTAAGEVSSSATEIARGNQHLSERTEEQASSLEETASSMEEMTSTVKQNADNAQQANALVLAARTQAEKGGAVVERAVAAMREINSSSSRIAAIIDVIDEIAFQTNLLALNAAVEAARAGEQGRGFAVVASEVRNLASRSAEAAKEIKTLITDSVAKVDGGSRLVDQSGQMLVEIVAAVNKVASIFSEITLASREQSVGIEQVNQAVMSMDEVTQQNAALVEEAAAAASTLMDQAKAMHERMAYFDVTGGGASAAPIEITAANVADAIPAHLAWRRRLRAAIASRGTVDAATLGRDDCCALGKWLHGPARSHFGSLPSHSRCTQAHAQFHREAGRIAGTINDKQYREAARLLEPGTGFSVASDACVEAVRALQEDVSRRQAA